MRAECWCRTARRTTAVLPPTDAVGWRWHSRSLIELKDTQTRTYKMLANECRGQIITSSSTAANVTIQHGNVIDGIALQSGANKRLATNESLMLINVNEVQRQI